MNKGIPNPDYQDAPYYMALMTLNGTFVFKDKKCFRVVEYDSNGKAVVVECDASEPFAEVNTTSPGDDPV